MPASCLYAWNSLLVCLLMNPMRTQSKIERKIKVKFKISTAVILEGCFRVKAGLRKLQCFNLAH